MAGVYRADAVEPCADENRARRKDGPRVGPSPKSMMIEPIAAIGSPMACPVYTRPTPTVRITVLAIQIQTWTDAIRLRSIAGCK
jgi:hypothetical protein